MMISRAPSSISLRMSHSYAPRPETPLSHPDRETQKLVNLISFLSSLAETQFDKKRNQLWRDQHPPHALEMVQSQAEDDLRRWEVDWDHIRKLNLGVRPAREASQLATENINIRDHFKNVAAALSVHALETEYMRRARSIQRSLLSFEPSHSTPHANLLHARLAPAFRSFAGLATLSQPIVPMTPHKPNSELTQEQAREEDKLTLVEKLVVIHSQFGAHFASEQHTLEREQSDEDDNDILEEEDEDEDEEHPSPERGRRKSSLVRTVRRKGSMFSDKAHKLARAFSRSSTARSHESALGVGWEEEGSDRWGRMSGRRAEMYQI